MCGTDSPIMLGQWLLLDFKLHFFFFLLVILNFIMINLFKYLILLKYLKIKKSIIGEKKSAKIMTKKLGKI